MIKRVDRFWSARIGLHYRAVAVEAPDGLLRFWIGTHGEYDKIVGTRRRNGRYGRTRAGGGHRQRARRRGYFKG